MTYWCVCFFAHLKSDLCTDVIKLVSGTIGVVHAALEVNEESVIETPWKCPH